MRITLLSLLSFIFYYFIYNSIHISFVSAECLEDQQSLLFQLKNNLTFIDTESSSKLKSWKQSIDCCYWSGVTCDNEGHVMVLDLSGESISGGLPRSIGNLRHLSNLDLSNCQFSGTLPNSLSNLTQLKYLDLSNNSFTGPIPSSLFTFPLLDNIDLSFNKFSELDELINVSSSVLSSLNLGNNNLSGPFSTFIFRLSSLSDLRLSYNNFNGSLHLGSGTLPNSLSNLTQLSSLDLSFNSFTGPIPSSLFTFPLLDNIDLSFNKFSELDELINVSSSVLRRLKLSNNNLLGPFPIFIFRLSSLSDLRLSYNNFNGSLHLGKLLELRNLIAIDLSYNNLSVDVNMTNANPTSIMALHMASCNLKTFPGFLINQSILASLDLSHNQIQGIVPNWIWKLQNVVNLNISHNLLTDLEGPLQNISSSLKSLDLHHNQLQGPILDSLCSASGLQLLDLSINNISGKLPSCLMTMTENLLVLNLRKNNLIGRIPDMFPAYCALTTLNLHENLLHGPIPESLANCTTLEVLDIGTNQMVGGFPCFLKKIPRLHVLVLRNNKFQGSLRCLGANEPWQMIQIVDIAVNNFSGKLAGKYFKTWDKMMHDYHSVSDFIHTGGQYLGWSGDYQDYTDVVRYYKNSNVNSTDEDHDHMGVGGYDQGRMDAGGYDQDPMVGSVYYQDSVTIFNKGQQMEIVKILTVFTAIDFSSNHFEGPIPDVLMDFKGLHVLNFSNNDLSGEIPSSIGNLQQLESLDLSSNSLHGKIPVQLASLSFLSYLNLSFNHLVGKILTGTQLQSFTASSFEGNDGLDGPPLTGKPGDKKEGLLPQPTCRRLACSIDWNFISVELGFVFGFGIVIGPLLFWKQWRVRYWKLADKILCWIFPQLYLEYATHRGQTYTVLRWWWH